MHPGLKHSEAKTQKTKTRTSPPEVLFGGQIIAQENGGLAAEPLIGGHAFAQEAGDLWASKRLLVSYRGEC